MFLVPSKFSTARHNYTRAFVKPFTPCDFTDKRILFEEGYPIFWKDLKIFRLEFCVRESTGNQGYRVGVEVLWRDREKHFSKKALFFENYSCSLPPLKRVVALGSEVEKSELGGDIFKSFLGKVWLYQKRLYLCTPFLNKGEAQWSEYWIKFLEAQTS